MQVDPRISSAMCLEELAEALRQIEEEEIDNPELDLLSDVPLPTFGGEPLFTTEGVFSWDAERVLVGDTLGETAIISREDFEAFYASYYD